MTSLTNNLQNGVQAAFCTDVLTVALSQYGHGIACGRSWKPIEIVVYNGLSPVARRSFSGNWADLFATLSFTYDL
jgi:hypothetical protein